MPMATCTKASGVMIKQMGMGYLLTPIMPCTLESGLMIPNMAMVKNSGIMVLLAIKDSSTKEKRTVKADLTGRMEATTMANSLMVSSKVLEFTISPTLIRPTKVSLDFPIWRAAELKPGQMGVAMREISRTGRKTARAPSNGPMGTSMSAAGETGNSMASASGYPLKMVKQPSDRVSG